MKRTFVAVRLPSPLGETLYQWTSKLDEPPELRPVTAENIHLTLAFLGDLAAADSIKLGERLAAIKTPRWRMNFTDLGSFTAHRRWVLWLGVEPHPTLLGLRRRVVECCPPFAAVTEKFTPHITLARAKARLDLGKLSPPTLPPPTIAGFSLMTSNLTSSGAVYNVVQNF